MKSFFTNKYVLDLVHIIVIVAPFVILRIPDNITNMTIGGVIALALTYLKSLIPVTPTA